MHPIWRKPYLNLGGSPLEPWRIPPPSTFIGKIRKAHWNAWLLLALALINSQHLCPKVHGHLAVPELLISCSENHNINSACIGPKGCKTSPPALISRLQPWPAAKQLKNVPMSQVSCHKLWPWYPWFIVAFPSRHLYCFLYVFLQLRSFEAVLGSAVPQVLVFGLSSFRLDADKVSHWY